MSTDTTHEGLDGDPVHVPEDHLTLTPENPAKVGISADPERGEFYCEDCNARITRSTTSHTEYGHRRDCEYLNHVGGAGHV